MSLHDAWEAEAERWTTWVRTPGHDGSWAFQAPFFLELVPAAGGLTLDVGCGEGRLARELAHRGHRVIGVDVAPTMIRRARDADPEGEYVVADAASLPFDDASADLVIAFMSLHDMDDMPGAIREAARVLAQGGRLCVAIVHPLGVAGEFGDDAFVLRDYFAEKPWYEVVERRGLRITLNSVHRPVEAYAGALEAAGFLIETLREPSPPDEIVARNEWWRRWRRVPMFLHLRAVKRTSR